MSALPVRTTFANLNLWFKPIDHNKNNPHLFNYPKSHTASDALKNKQAKKDW